MTQFLQQLSTLKASHPKNLALQCLQPDYYSSLSADQQSRLRFCIRSGIENPDSQMGCYASHSSDYEEFEPFFSEVISRHHGVSNQAAHQSNWSLIHERLHLGDAGVPPLSIRVRVARNVTGWPLPAAMTREERLQFENRMHGVFQVFKESPFFGGDYYSLTPGHKNLIDDRSYQSLVGQHYLFKPMDNDRYLHSAGIAGDWPDGRGCYLSSDRSVNIWVGEEDHLRIMVFKRGLNLQEPYERVRQIVDMLSDHGGLDFAHSERYGVITSCPTNLGTGMRASLHLRLPAIFKPGVEKLSAEGIALAKSTGLSVRGGGGEHTPPAADGTVDVSPTSRYGVSEADTIKNLFRGACQLIELDRRIAGNQEVRDRTLLVEEPVP